MALSKDEVDKILHIIGELEFSDIRLEIGDLKIHVQKGSAGAVPAATDSAGNGHAFAEARQALGTAEPHPTPDEGTAPDIPTLESDTVHVVKSPVTGVFYRSPEPGRDPYVTVGDHVNADATVCLVEVMKLFQSVPAGSIGRVAAIFVENGAAVSEDQPLMAIERNS